MMMSLLVDLMLVLEEDLSVRSMAGVVVAKSQSLLAQCLAGTYSHVHQAVGQVAHQFVDRYAVHSENRPR